MVKSENQTVHALLSKIEEQSKRIEYLEKTIGLSVPFSYSLGLTPKEEKILGLLLNNKLVRSETILELLYSSRWNKPDPSIIRTFITYIRNKIKPHNIHIRNLSGIGYFMDENDKAIARALVGSRAA